MHIASTEVRALRVDGHKPGQHSGEDMAALVPVLESGQTTTSRDERSNFSDITAPSRVRLGRKHPCLEDTLEGPVVVD